MSTKVPTTLVLGVCSCEQAWHLPWYFDGKQFTVSGITFLIKVRIVNDSKRKTCHLFLDNHGRYFYLDVTEIGSNILEDGIAIIWRQSLWNYKRMLSKVKKTLKAIDKKHSLQQWLENKAKEVVFE